MLNIVGERERPNLGFSRDVSDSFPFVLYCKNGEQVSRTVLTLRFQLVCRGQLAWIVKFHSRFAYLESRKPSVYAVPWCHTRSNAGATQQSDDGLVLSTIVICILHALAVHGKLCALNI